MQETLVQPLGREDSLEKEQATHSSILGLPCGSAGKESTCNAGDVGSIPGLGRSPGEEKGYPLQYSCMVNSMDYTVHESHKESDTTEWLSWASLLAHLVKHLPVMRENQVGSQGWEDPLEKEMATHSSILTWKIPWTEEPCRLQSMGSQRVGHDWATSLSFYFIFWQEGGSIGETSFPLLPGLSPPLIP